MLGRVVAVSLLLAPFAATARPPPGPAPDPATAAWFHSLTNENTGMRCCDISDCRPVDEVRIQNGHYSVRVFRSQFVMSDYDESAWSDRYGAAESIWISIPDDAITYRPDNPVGRSVLCFSAVSERVFCFLPREFGG
jgi:hypothetical protein